MFEHQTLTVETRYVQPKFFKMLLFVITVNLSFQFVLFICRILKSETSLKFSKFDREDFVKIRNFDG